MGFLEVRGSLRTYKIHLGPANILMEPDDSYLCIARGHDTFDRLLRPFEDELLALILSKAFLLAETFDRRTAHQGVDGR